MVYEDGNRGTAEDGGDEETSGPRMNDVTSVGSGPPVWGLRLAVVYFVYCEEREPELSASSWRIIQDGVWWQPRGNN